MKYLTILITVLLTGCAGGVVIHNGEHTGIRDSDHTLCSLTASKDFAGTIEYQSEKCVITVTGAKQVSVE